MCFCVHYHEYEFMFISVNARILRLGLFLWIAGTVGVRLGGHHLLHPHRKFQTVALYLVSFALMALLGRRIFRRLGVQRDAWQRAAALLILPTLLLDPFSCAFFTIVFPNLDPGAAGVFGGWMLICCGGAVAGTWIKP
jgi:hypothetical protein